MNGTTNEDRTLYFETLPANQLELALFLEADRMKSLDITKENLDNQRNAVQEERRLGVDNQPYGKTSKRSTSWPTTTSPTSTPSIGSMEDLERGDGRRRGGVLQDLLRAEQRGARRSSAMSTPRRTRSNEKYFGAIPAQPHRRSAPT